MSYILDALRRADSERERGAVPSIHSHPVPPVVDDPKPARAQPQAVLVAVIVVLLLALAGLLAWHLMSGGKEAPAQPAVATAPVAQETVPTPPPQMPTQALPQAPVQGQQAQRQEPAMPNEPAPGPQAPAMTMPLPKVAPAMPSAPPVRQAQPEPAPAPAAPAPVTPSADTRVYAVHELPANIQRDLPKLVVGGAMYSDTPANRMLIINSQVFHEGDKLSADLLLQEIKLKSAVFQYKGYRYGVNY